jgi:hypothetical protein
MPDSNDMEKFKRMRSQILIKGVLLFVITVIALFVWVYFYSVINYESDLLFFAGAGVILGWCFFAIKKLEKSIICPACQASLVDVDGWNLFIKSCPNCKVKLQ